MPLSNDSKEFIASLNSHGIEYLIVGAHALAFHARPRFTGDLDILIRPTPETAAKVVAVLNKFGFGSLGVSASDFATHEQLIQLGRAPNRIDLLTSISGVDIDDDLPKVASHALDASLERPWGYAGNRRCDEVLRLARSASACRPVIARPSRIQFPKP